MSEPPGYDWAGRMARAIRQHLIEVRNVPPADAVLIGRAAVDVLRRPNPEKIKSLHVVDFPTDEAGRRRAVVVANFHRGMRPLLTIRLGHFRSLVRGGYGLPGGPTRTGPMAAKSASASGTCRGRAGSETRLDGGSMAIGKAG